MRSVKFMRAAKTSYIVLSALYCVFGVLLIAVPDFSMKLLGILVGCMMIGFGAVKLMGYFSRDLYRLAFQFDLAYGILLIVLGLIVLVRPVQLVSFFCLVLGICILADGLFKIQAASDSKRFGLRPWWLILTLAIVACLAGLLLVFSPMDGARALLAGAERLGVERPAQRVLTGLAYALGLSMVVLGLYGAWLGHVNLSLLCAGPYLAYAAHASGVAQSVRRMQRAQDAARKLAEGRMMPVGAYACAGPPSRLTLARMAGRLSDLRYHLLLVVDPDTGRISESMTEGELTQRLFHTQEQAQGR